MLLDKNEVEDANSLDNRCSGIADTKVESGRNAVEKLTFESYKKDLPVLFILIYVSR